MTTFSRASLSFLLLGLAAIPVAVLPACDDSGGGEEAGGGAGGSGGAPSTEVCDNDLDDDANGDVDCLDAACAAAERCQIGGNECDAQLPACEPDLSGSINEICNAGSCAAAGPIKPNAQLRRGNMVISNRLDGVLDTLPRSFAVRVYHPARPDGSTLTCRDLLALPDVAVETGGATVQEKDPAQVNVVLRSTGAVAQGGDTIPTPSFGLPISEGTHGFLVLTTFYSADRDTLTAEPQGEKVGEGCGDGMVVLEGDWVEDPDHSFGLEVKPICDPANDLCPFPKTCLIGARLCRDQRCDPACTSGTACRDLGDGPACRRKCDPSNPQCANLELCDATVGEIPVCAPAE